MNEVISTLLARRSCRGYQKKQVEEEKLNEILEAGLYAPTGMGRQSTRFVVVQNPDDLAALSRLNAAVMGSNGDPFYGAPAVILVLADPAVPTCVEDGALAMGNLMNAAAALGLGSCWIHRARQVFDSAEGKALLRKWGVPEGLTGIGHCALGYAAAAPQQAVPRKDGRVFRA